MKIYTKKGDKGQTQLIGKRVSKTHARVESYGTVDELNSFIGVAIAELDQEDMISDLEIIQHELFDIGGDLANVTEKKEWALKEASITRLEHKIDAYWAEAPELKTFILPGGEKAAAHLHVCRTVARRAERLTVAIDDGSELPPFALAYLNRLSDYFFAAARAVNARKNREDILYKRGKDVFK
ncbi:cob(I)yrinic acid a,c-diamide adenosyltransferase [Paenalkalicoccus suaedae]|uniref:Corrinoid adenosyltransferase n=1 Tax=Paenalkalicoccus suaedae TaxID=2592382 RepID=A0A859FEP0_9BACI|nr:cob(I)yrinic acid a,c-diamide adenosyltransferase [Paenalkalicoccus suaedae]QKS71054.1 cob(I)yrinic acid a,c-diamide adenosyltransferase [Paenalkalicoccus suaedae]